MRTAKDIIEEFRARGYGMESLRVLADSRDEPIRSEMLAILADEIGGEAAGDDMAFFVVADEERIEEVGADIIDFDIMASNLPPAAGDESPLAITDESVAEIAVGDDAGSGFVVLDRNGNETPLYSRNEEPVESAPTAEIPAEAPANAVISAAPEPAAAIPESGENNSETEGEAEAGHLILSESAPPFVSEADHSDDYLPGSVSEPLDEFRIESSDNADVAKQALAEAQRVLAEAKISLEAPAPADPGDAFGASGQKRESKSERRRRRRAERKRAKEAKQVEEAESRESAAGILVINNRALPEIVLSASEGTETLSQESCRDLVCNPPASNEAEPAAEECGMIPANANLALTMAQMREDAQSVADQQGGEEETSGNSIVDASGEAEGAGENAIAEQIGDGNVLRLFDMVENDGWLRENDGENGGFVGTLRLLEDNSEDITDGAAASGGEETRRGEEALSPMARLGLLRALTGGEAPVCDTECGEADASPDDHVIVQPEPEVEAVQGPDETALAEMEKDYQSRLDDFAKRLLDLQTAAAASDIRLREQAAELVAREKAATEAEQKAAAGEKAIRGLTADLAGLADELAEKKSALEKFTGLHEEHKRLYREFEDLRKAYNEVVAEVMPALQNERDELVMTVERQEEDEERLRSALKVSGRRMAVGYSLAAAAAVMMVALPLTHWMRAGDTDQRLAIGHQQVSELRERLDKAELRNVKADEEIFSLKRETNLARLDLDKRTRELALLKADLAAGGGSARTVAATVAAGESQTLHGPTRQNKPTRVNEVRDPGGSINQVLAENRERYAREDAQLAAASKPQSRTGAVALSSVASAQPSRPTLARTAPQVAAQPANAPDRGDSRASGQVAVVKAGEGVAQVVYRVLGTRDPEVVAWVIRENNIKKDKRGNPRIYPEQKLLLPSDNGESAKSASAAKR